MSERSTGEAVCVYNRPARVEKRLPSTSIVRWLDNGVQGFVPTDLLPPEEEHRA